MRVPPIAILEKADQEHFELVVDLGSGLVTIVQRFGAALNLNVHIHALVMDGVFVPDSARGVRFCPVQPMGADDVAALLTTLERRIEKLLARRGVSDGNEGCDVPDR